MEFTDLHSAIKKARYLRSITRKNHVVLQCAHAPLKVIQLCRARTAGRSVMFSTKYDKHHSVLRG